MTTRSLLHQRQSRVVSLFSRDGFPFLRKKSWRNRNLRLAPQPLEVLSQRIVPSALVVFRRFSRLRADTFRCDGIKHCLGDDLTHRTVVVH